MRSTVRTALLVALAVAGSACGDDDAPARDGGPALDASPSLDAGPVLDGGPVLADAGCNGPPGLFVPGSCETLAEGVRPYEPRFALWSDGASKGRWVYLPPATTIDTTDPDDWVFPVGTRLYKEFGLGAQRLETRLLEKTGVDPGLSSWTVATYVWDDAQTSVTEETHGVVDVLGTPHDVPTRVQCASCHRSSLDTVLGFSAIQLAHDGAGVTLATLVAEGRLSTPIDPTSAQIPGDDVTRAALGYLHANCGACHRGTLAPAELRFHVDVGLSAATDAAAYAAIGRTPSYSAAPAIITAQIVAGDPDASLVVWRMMQRTPATQMPPLGTEVVDTDGLARVRAWITALPPI